MTNLKRMHRAAVAAIISEQDSNKHHIKQQNMSLPGSPHEQSSLFLCGSLPAL